MKRAATHKRAPVHFRATEVKTERVGMMSRILAPDLNHIVSLNIDTHGSETKGSMAPHYDKHVWINYIKTLEKMCRG